MIDRIVHDLMYTPLKKPVKTACAHCGQYFMRTLPSYTQMYCSDSCLHADEIEAAEMLLMSNISLSPVQEQFITRVLGI